MEKLKVNSETFIALETLVEMYGVNESLHMHSRIIYKNSRNWSGKQWDCLNKLTLCEMAQALYSGYEVEETPEERVIKKYIEKSILIATNSENKWEHDAYINGIRFTLETLNIKIKGIND